MASFFEKYEARAKDFWQQFGVFETPDTDDESAVFKSTLKYSSLFMVVEPLSLFVARWRKAEKIIHQSQPAGDLQRRDSSSSHQTKNAQEIGKLPLTCVVEGQVCQPLLHMGSTLNVTIVLVGDLMDATISCRYSKNGAKQTKKDFIKECFKDEVAPAATGFGGQCNIAYFSEIDGLSMLFHYQKYDSFQALKRWAAPKEMEIPGYKIEDCISSLKKAGWVF